MPNIDPKSVSPKADPFKCADPYSQAKVMTAMGWKLFPIQYASKIPATKNGFYDAVDNARSFQELCTRTSGWPPHNIGVVTGRTSGLVVLDVDAKNGGIDTLQALIEKHGPLPETIQSQTGGGGQHYYFLFPENLPDGTLLPSAHGLWKGIDVKSDGGYVVTAPGSHPSGGKYKWLSGLSPYEAQMAPLPDWILEALIKRKRKSINDAIERADATGDDGSGLIIPEGRRNAALTSLAGSMRRRGMTTEAILAALLAENEARCVPPLPESEVASISQSIMRYDPEDPVGQVVQDPMKALPVADLDKMISEDVPPPDWLIPHRICRGDICLLVGEPGIGKSFLALDLAVSLASGTEALGTFIYEKPLRVLYIDEENHEMVVRERLQGAIKARPGFNLEVFKSNFKILNPCAGFTFRDKEKAVNLARMVRAYQPDLLVLDSMTAVGDYQDEASATAIRGFFTRRILPLRSICPGLTIVLVHHTNKMIYKKEQEVDFAGMVRGSIDIAAAADSVLLARRHGAEIDDPSDRILAIQPVKVRRGQAGRVVMYKLEAVPGTDTVIPFVFGDPDKEIEEAEKAKRADKEKVILARVLFIEKFRDDHTPRTAEGWCSKASKEGIKIPPKVMKSLIYDLIRDRIMAYSDGVVREHKGGRPIRSFHFLHPATPG